MIIKFKTLRVGYCNWMIDVDRNWKDFDHYHEHSHEEENDGQMCAKQSYQFAHCTTQPLLCIYHVDHWSKRSHLKLKPGVDLSMTDR